MSIWSLLQNTHNRHTITQLWGSDIGCLLSIQWVFFFLFKWIQCWIYNHRLQNACNRHPIAHSWGRDMRSQHRNMSENGNIFLYFLTAMQQVKAQSSHWHKLLPWQPNTPTLWCVSSTTSPASNASWLHIILMDMGTIGWYQTTTKHNQTEPNGYISWEVFIGARQGIIFILTLTIHFNHNQNKDVIFLYSLKTIQYIKAQTQPRLSCWPNEPHLWWVTCPGHTLALVDRFGTLVGGVGISPMSLISVQWQPH